MTAGPMGQLPAGYAPSSPSAGLGEWRAPDVGGSGQLTVDRSVLRNVAAQMNADLRVLDAALAGCKAPGTAAGPSSGWSTGNAFSGNADNAYTGMVQAGSAAGDTHSSTSKKLVDNAATTTTPKRTARVTSPASGSCFSPTAARWRQREEAEHGWQAAVARRTRRSTRPPE